MTLTMTPTSGEGWYPVTSFDVDAIKYLNKMALRTYLLTVCGVIEMVLFSGVIFGWANMVLILKNEGYFSDLCGSSVNGTKKQSTTNGEHLNECKGQSDRLSLAFTIAVFSFNVAGFVGGVILDRYGTRVTRLTACFFFFLSGLLALFMEKETANLTFGLVIFLGISGMLVAVSVFQIAQLYQRTTLVVSCLFSGALDSSSVVFLIFKVCYDSGARLRWVLITYTGVAIVWVASTTFGLMPKTSFALENANRQDIGNPSGNLELGRINYAATVIGLQEDAIEPNQPAKAVNESTKPVKDDEYSNGWRYICTPRYLWLVYYLSLIQLRLWFFVGSLNAFFVFRTDNDKDKINRYTEIFGIAQFFGFVFAPITGIIMNVKPKNISHPYFGLLCSFIITNVLDVLLGVLVLVPVLQVQYLSFVVQVGLRAFLYASQISFVLRAFPNIHYGKLYGFCTTVGAIVNLLQYPAFIILDGPFNGEPFWVNLGFLALAFTGFGLPLYLWLSHKEEGETTTSF